MGPPENGIVCLAAGHIKESIRIDRGAVSRAAGQNRHAPAGFDYCIARQNAACHGEFYRRSHRKAGKHIVLQFERLVVVLPLKTGFRGNGQIQLRAG